MGCRAIYILMENSNLNVGELNKIVREMQDESLAKHLAANNFNQKAADLVKQGADDKMRAKGWPVNSPKPLPEKKVM